MTTDDPIVQFVAWCEGFRSAPYLDAGGIWTIGYGFTCLDGETVGPKTRSLSQVEAARLLRESLGKTERLVQTLLPGIKLDPWQTDALASFCFNVGIRAWQVSTMYDRLLKGKMREAAKEFPKWCHVDGQVEKGLVWRRYWERQIFEHGYEAVKPLLEAMHHAKAPPPTIVL